MAKEKAPAYQQYPKDDQSDSNYQAMTWAERGMYRHLKDLCWLEMSIPADPELICRILQIPFNKEFEQGSWPLLRSFFTEYQQDSVRLIHPGLEEQRQKHAEWRAKCAAGGRASAHKPKKKQTIIPQQGSLSLVPSKTEVTGNTSYSILHTSNSDVKDTAAASQASPPGEESQDPVNPSGKSERPKDAAYEAFCSEFVEHRKIPYRGTKGDFTQLAGLRQQLGLENLKAPDTWTDSIHNYFKTPQGKYTLADLCSRYDVFLSGPLDRFGKPKEDGHAGTPGNNSGIREANPGGSANPHSIGKWDPSKELV